MEFHRVGKLNCLSVFLGTMWVFNQIFFSSPHSVDSPAVPGSGLILPRFILFVWFLIVPKRVQCEEDVFSLTPVLRYRVVV